MDYETDRDEDEVVPSGAEQRTAHDLWAEVVMALLQRDEVLS